MCYRVVVEAVKRGLDTVSKQLKEEPSARYWHSSAWTFERDRGVGQQTPGGNDCGVFTSVWTVMEGVGMDLGLLPRERCSRELRYKIAYSILSTDQQELNATQTLGKYNVGACFLDDA